MTQLNWTLVVRTVYPDALPNVPWWHPMDGRIPELFGFRCRYYNPCCTDQAPVILKASCIAMYGIEPPDTQAYVCELSPELITHVLLIPLLPGELREMLATHGWHTVWAAAQFRYPTQVRAAAA